MFIKRANGRLKQARRRRWRRCGKLRTEKMAEVKEFRLRLDHLRTHKDTPAARLRADAAAGERQEAEHVDTIRHIDAQVAEIAKARCHCLRSACPSQLQLHTRTWL